MRFPIRVNDDSLWAQFAKKCAERKLSINTVLLQLIQAFVDGKVTIGARRA